LRRCPCGELLAIFHITQFAFLNPLLDNILGELLDRELNCPCGT